MVWRHAIWTKDEREIKGKHRYTGPEAGECSASLGNSGEASWCNHQSLLHMLKADLHHDPGEWQPQLGENSSARQKGTGPSCCCITDCPPTLLLYYGLGLPVAVLWMWEAVISKIREFDLAWMSEAHTHFCLALSMHKLYLGWLFKETRDNVSRPGTSPSTCLAQLSSRRSCPNLIRLSFWVSQFLRGY